MKKIRIASGAGYAGDRIEPAVDLMLNGNINYIVFECLAERTIAIAQQEKLKDPNKGYNGLLEYRFEKILPICKEKNIKVITNMGAANPLGAIKKIKSMAEEMNIKGLKIAAVLGDDISDKLDRYLDCEVLELKTPLNTIKDKLVSANVYLGVDGIVEALKNGADIVVTGRCADPAIFMAPLIYEFGWDVENYDLIGKGIMIGHLLECGAQVCGGYFAVPGYNEVEDLWNVVFPIAEVSENGDVVITKTETSGGVVSTHTCKEQLIYEIHDPKNYMTPDGVAMREIGELRFTLPPDWISLPSASFNAIVPFSVLPMYIHVISHPEPFPTILVVQPFSMAIEVSDPAASFGVSSVPVRIVRDAPFKASCSSFVSSGYCGRSL